MIDTISRGQDRSSVVQDLFVSLSYVYYNDVEIVTSVETVIRDLVTLRVQYCIQHTLLLCNVSHDYRFLRCTGRNSNRIMYTIPTHITEINNYSEISENNTKVAVV